MRNPNAADSGGRQHLRLRRQEWYIPAVLQIVVVWKNRLIWPMRKDIQGTDAPEPASFYVGVGDLAVVLGFSAPCDLHPARAWWCISACVAVVRSSQGSSAVAIDAVSYDLPVCE